MAQAQGTKKTGQKKAGNSSFLPVQKKTIRAAVAALSQLTECSGPPGADAFAAGRDALASLRKIKGVNDGNA